MLVVSADMGAGHNATAAALEREIEERWPGSQITRVDTLEVMRAAVGPVFRRIYVVNVEWTPWLYEFFYASLWRHRRFAQASKRFTGSWSGRRLAPIITRLDPDFIVSTFPLGSAGLAWLRQHRGLAVPVGAWVSDFAPHPFWVYGDVDLTVVMHQVSAETALAAEPAANVTVGTAPTLVAAAAQGLPAPTGRMADSPSSWSAAATPSATSWTALPKYWAHPCRTDGRCERQEHGAATSAAAPPSAN
jgi:diacylglycerol O-acyltransferase / wax synthase